LISGHNKENNELNGFELT